MAAHFNEVNSEMHFADHVALTLPDGDWTIAGWIRLTDNIGAAYQAILSWGAYSAAPSLNWFFTEEDEATPNRLVCLTEDAGADQVNFVSAGTPGTSVVWQHLILQRSGTTVTQYINGAADGAETLATFDDVNVAGVFYFGRRTGSTWWLGGDMAEWAKWDRALNAGERAALAKGFAPTFFPGLKWYMPMIRGYQELVVPLTVTNNGSTVVSHLPMIYPFGPTVMRPRAKSRADVEVFLGPQGELIAAQNVVPVVHYHLREYKRVQAATVTPQGGAYVYPPPVGRVSQHDFKRWTPMAGVVLWPLGTPPKGWICCNGYELNRVVYKKLYDVLGTDFGSGDGTTTFNIPDLSGSEPSGFMYIIKIDEPNWIMQRTSYG